MPQLADILHQVPSSRANLPAKPRSQLYTMSIQRRESNNQGRWREIASWTLTTAEEDMSGPLNCGLRPNYRIVVVPLSEGLPVDATDSNQS